MEQPNPPNVDPQRFEYLRPDEDMRAYLIRLKVYDLRKIGYDIVANRPQLKKKDDWVRAIMNHNRDEVIAKITEIKLAEENAELEQERMYAAMDARFHNPIDLDQMRNGILGQLQERIAAQNAELEAARNTVNDMFTKMHQLIKKTSDKIAIETNVENIRLLHALTMGAIKSLIPVIGVASKNNMNIPEFPDIYTINMKEYMQKKNEMEKSKVTNAANNNVSTVSTTVAIAATGTVSAATSTGTITGQADQ